MGYGNTAFVLNIDNILKERCDQHLTSVPPMTIVLVAETTSDHVTNFGKTFAIVYLQITKQRDRCKFQ